jgi:hypothetical protein
MGVHVADVGVGCLVLIAIVVIILIGSFALDVLKGATGPQVIAFGIIGVSILVGGFCLFCYAKDR